MKTIGILGGMGPEATSHFLNLIIKHTPAKIDQEHIPIIVWNNPKIPDRTDYINGKGGNPLPHLIEGAMKLKKSGADFIVIPCVTAHYFFDELLEAVKIPFLNIIDETIKYQQNKFPKIKRVGLIASSGTLKTKLFQSYYKNTGIKIITSNKADQKKYVMEAIYGIKGIKAGYKNKPRKLLLEAGKKLIKGDAQAIIAGCTESAIVLRERNCPVPLLNSLKILAIASIKCSREIKS